MKIETFLRTTCTEGVMLGQVSALDTTAKLLSGLTTVPVFLKDGTNLVPIKDVQLVRDLDTGAAYVELNTVIQM